MPTDKQLANGLTKALDATKWANFLENIHLY